MTQIRIDATEPGCTMRLDCPDCVWDVERDPRTGRVTIVHGLKPCDTCRKTTLHASVVDITGDRWKWPKPSPKLCHRCGADMTYPAVHGEAGAHHGDETSNECNLMFVGGYGSFIDSMGEIPTVTICHECAHLLCDWLGVDPRNWHTHSVYGGQHPDHHDNRS